MSVTIENTTITATRTRQQSPTAYLKSEYNAQKIGEIFAVRLDSLKIDPDFNKRINYDLEDLKTFIKENGIVFPALRLMYVDGEMYIDEGHRRHKACIELDLPGDTPIPVYIGAASSPTERLARQVTSNSGKNYTSIEKVAVAKVLMQQYNLDQTQVAKMFGTSQGAISNMTKFFSYSQLMFAAIDANDIKYSRVLELNKKGYSESDILAIVARDKQMPEIEQAEELPELGNLEDVSTNTEVEDSFESVSDDTEVESDDPTVVINLSDRNKTKLANLLEDDKTPKAATPVKAKNTPLTVTHADIAPKKANAAKLLTDFISSAEIIDNGDDTFSYKITKSEHMALQRGCKNI